MTLDDFRRLQTSVIVIVWSVVGLVVLAGVSYAVWTVFH